jgi:hypothetical protein
MKFTVFFGNSEPEPTQATTPSCFDDINFLGRLPKYPQIPNFMKIHPVGAKLFPAER